MTKKFISQGGASPMNCEQFFTKYNCGLQVDPGSVGCLWTPAKSGTPDSGYDTKAYACKMQPGSAACDQNGEEKKHSGSKDQNPQQVLPKSTAAPVQYQNPQQVQCPLLKQQMSLNLLLLPLLPYQNMWPQKWHPLYHLKDLHPQLPLLLSLPLLLVFLWF